MNEPLPTISVVTPSYNQAAFLERTLLSVVEQEYPEVEHIVFDGESTDDSVAILERYSDHLAFWRSEPDRGQTHAINKGFARANGEIIGWLNSDDIYYPGTFHRIAQSFAENPDINFIYGMANHIDCDDQVINQYYTEKWDFQRLKKLCFICQPAMFFRRKVLDRYGYLDESMNFSMDYEYWLRCGSEESFMFLEVPLAGSRLYAENKTLGSRALVLEENLRMLKGKFHTVDKQWIASYAIEKARTSFGRGRGFFHKIIGSAYAGILWHKFLWQYNREIFPILPKEFLMNTFLLPKRVRLSISRHAEL